MSILQNLIDAGRAITEALRMLEQHRLKTIDAAFSKTIPALEALDSMLKTGSSSAIVQQAEKTADEIDSIRRELEENNIEPGFFPELSKQLRRASTWEYYPTLKEEYKHLSPTIVESLKGMHKQVKDRLSARP